MNVKQVEIGGKKYNVGQASAANQKKLLSMIGAKVALSSAASETETIDSNLLFGAMLSISEPEFDAIADIVLHQTIENGKDSVVDIGDFQNEVTHYYQLVAEAVVVNLADFFTYLDSVNAETRKAAKKVR